MVGDLVANHLRPGVAMRRVRRLLGAPDEVASDGTWFYSVDFEGDFLLGTCVGLELYPKASRLAHAEITRDD